MNRPVTLKTIVFWTIAVSLAFIVCLQGLDILLDQPVGAMRISILTGFFTVLTFGILFLGLTFVGHRNPNLFTGITMMASLMKIMGGIIFLVVYRKLYQPDTKIDIVYFFILYVAFTILELWMLHNMARREAMLRRKQSGAHAHG